MQNFSGNPANFFDNANPSQQWAQNPHPPGGNPYTDTGTQMDSWSQGGVPGQEQPFSQQGFGGQTSGGTFGGMPGGPPGIGRVEPYEPLNPNQSWQNPQGGIMRGGQLRHSFQSPNGNFGGPPGPQGVGFGSPGPAQGQGNNSFGQGNNGNGNQIVITSSAMALALQQAGGGGGGCGGGSQICCPRIRPKKQCGRPVCGTAQNLCGVVSVRPMRRRKQCCPGNDNSCNDAGAGGYQNAIALAQAAAAAFAGGKGQDFGNPPFILVEGRPKPYRRCCGVTGNAGGGGFGGGQCCPPSPTPRCRPPLVVNIMAPPPPPPAAAAAAAPQGAKKVSIASSSGSGSGSDDDSEGSDSTSSGGSDSS